MKISFEIKSVDILRGKLVDTIVFRVSDNTTPFPEKSKSMKMIIEPKLQIETEAGYAEEWLKQNEIDCDVNVIDTVYGVYNEKVNDTVVIPK